METPHKPLAFTVAQLRASLGPGVVGRSTLYEAIRRGDLRTVRLGKKILIPATAVTEWLAGAGNAGQETEDDHRR
jgi:excisionase family DNA binding protein